MITEDDLNLTHLGKQSVIESAPDKAKLDLIPNPHRGTDYIARFTVPEFTSLCPATGQPDFAVLVIDYAPGRFLVESKSLKLYMFAFRNHGAFHEDVTITIGKRLFKELSPYWLRIGGFWFPRGGIPIDIVCEWGMLPDKCSPLDLAIKPYLGRSVY